MEEFCKQRELFLRQYKDTKETFEKHISEISMLNINEDNSYFSKLKELLQMCLRNLERRNRIFNLQEYQSENTEKIKELDNNFYFSVYEILRIIAIISKDKRDDGLEKVQIYFEMLKNQYETQNFFQQLKKLGIFMIRHTFLLTLLLMLVGIIVLGSYFYFYVEYLPILSRDSALYYIVAVAGLGILFTLVISAYFLCSIYMVHKIFYDIPSPKISILLIFAILIVLPTIGIFLLIVFDVQSILKSISIALSILIVYIIIVVLFIVKKIHLRVEKILLSFLIAFMLTPCYIIIMNLIIGFDSIKWGNFILISCYIIACFIVFIAALAKVSFNIVKLLFYIEFILFFATLPFSSYFIVKKLQIGNYTAEKLIFKQEAEEDIKSCKYEMGANNTLVLSNINIISSLGDYILFECEDKETSNMNNKIEHRDNKNKQDMKTKILQIRVPTYYLVGEIARPSSQDVKEALDSTLVSNEAISN